MSEIGEYERLADSFENQAKEANKIGLYFAAALLFPVIHYIGFIGFWVCTWKKETNIKRACYYRGVVDGLAGIVKNG